MGNQMKAEKFYRDNEDWEDQRHRRLVNAERVYTKDARCEFCGTQLDGAAFQCVRCDSLTCESCVCEDGCCPACGGSGKVGSL